jgi:hypothetical protein
MECGSTIFWPVPENPWSCSTVFLKPSYAWRKIIPALSEHYTVVAPDLRGSYDHGLNPLSELDFKSGEHWKETSCVIPLAAHFTNYLA